MAVIWSKQGNEGKIEVRTAGSVRRLYKDGILHSQYNPNNPVTGSVWDLLSIPALLMNRKPKNVLILGLGGGAVVHGLRSLLGQDLKITAVELSEDHVQIAKRFFEIDDSINIFCEDGIDWIQQYQGDQFDLIIEDMFYEGDDGPCRVKFADKEWFDLLLSNLSQDGALILNFEEGKTFKNSDFKLVEAEFNSVIRFSTATCYNWVVGFFRDGKASSNLNPILKEFRYWDKSKKSSKLNVSSKSLKFLRH